MPKNLAIKVNILVCLVIITGFAVVSVINHKTNQNSYMDSIEQTSDLISEGVYYHLEAIFTRPVSVSQTMAANSLLKGYLLSESHEENEEFTNMIQAYLSVYKNEQGFDTVFFASAKTGRYYTADGINRVLSHRNDENEWYYRFLESDEEYTLNVDNDEASGNETTIFVNCRIRGNSGEILGIIGVGMRIDFLQAFLEECANRYNSEIYLINESGGIEIAVDNNGLHPVNFFDVCGYPYLKDEILSNNVYGENLSRWISEGNVRNYVVTQYIPENDWYLIVEHNTAAFDEQVNEQFFRMLLMAVITGLLAITAVAYTISKYNKQIVSLTTSIEREKQAAFRNATEQLYDNIYELNITKNHAIGGHTQRYFESLGMAADTPYDEALKTIAEKNIFKEHQKEYIFTFSPENVLHEYNRGNTSLKCDLLSCADGTEYYWLRIMGHIYYRQEDESICMFTYRKNIDEEKRKEERLSAQAQLDGLTNVYNKTSTEQQILQMIAADRGGSFAFFIIDIDNFKQINDGCGHGFGDFAISKFAAIIKSCFRHGDVIGRIGGDEFVAFLPVPDEDWTKNKAAELSKALDTEIFLDGVSRKVSASIGVAFATKESADFKDLYKTADDALYETKRQGKNGYCVYNVP